MNIQTIVTEYLNDYDLDFNDDVSQNPSEDDSAVLDLTSAGFTSMYNAVVDEGFQVAYIAEETDERNGFPLIRGQYLVYQMDSLQGIYPGLTRALYSILGLNQRDPMSEAVIKVLAFTTKENLRGNYFNK